MHKILSVLALSFALAAVAGCDAGIAGSSDSAPSNGSPSCSKSKCDSQAASRAAGDVTAAPANPNCASGGSCDFTPECDTTDCPKPMCEETQEPCPSQKKCEPKAHE